MLLRIDYIRVLWEKLHTHEGINFLWKIPTGSLITRNMYVCMYVGAGYFVSNESQGWILLPRCRATCTHHYRE